MSDRLPDDLRDTAADLHFDSLPFAPLYCTGVEFAAAELSNRTVQPFRHWIVYPALMRQIGREWNSHVPR